MIAPDLAQEQINAIVTAALQAGSFDTDEAIAAVAAAKVGDHLLLQGNLSLDATRACAQVARERGAIVVLNPSPIAFQYEGLWALIDIVVANEDECRALGDATSASHAARNLLEAGAERVTALDVGRGQLDWRLRTDDRVTICAREVS